MCARGSIQKPVNFSIINNGRGFISEFSRGSQLWTELELRKQSEIGGRALISFHKLFQVQYFSLHQIFLYHIAISLVLCQILVWRENNYPMRFKVMEKLFFKFPSCWPIRTAKFITPGHTLAQKSCSIILK